MRRATEFVSGIGVLVGGLLTGELSWRWIFIVNIVFAVVIVVLALRATPESRDPNAPRRVDIPGALLTATGLINELAPSATPRPAPTGAAVGSEPAAA